MGGAAGSPCPNEAVGYSPSTPWSPVFPLQLLLPMNVRRYDMPTVSHVNLLLWRVTGFDRSAVYQDSPLISRLSFDWRQKLFFISNFIRISTEAEVWQHSLAPAYLLVPALLSTVACWRNHFLRILSRLSLTSVTHDGN